MARVEPSGQSTARVILGAGGSQADPEARRILARVRAGLVGSDGPNRIGRYEVGEEIGAGGMGVVHVARDPQLQRDVALKIVPAHSRRHARRLLREARTLARLSHPNVVEVYDAVATGREVCLAMELIDGLTLEQWLAQQPSRARLLEVLGAAGDGLAAAHAMGIVHRDFKPSNVMVARDGRVRVLDFGLARTATERSTVSGEGPDPAQALADADLLTRGDATRPGAVMGTPAYMSPEQAHGSTADARSDQFSFCVVVYEALYGKRPFVGDSLTDTLMAIIDARIEFPARPRIPASVRRVLTRGLQPRPDDRYPSMRPLLLQLRRRVPRRALFVASISMVAVAATAAAWPATTTCPDPAAVIAETWNPARADEVRRGFAALPGGDGLARRVIVALDRYTERWAAVHGTECAGQGSAFDARRACLDERRRSLSGLVDVLADPDQDIARRAPSAVAALPDPDQCADPDYLEGRVAPPADPVVAAQVAGLRSRLAISWALQRTGKFAPGLAAAEQVHLETTSLAYDPIRAEALYARGAAHGELGEVGRSIEDLEEAFWLAQSAGHDEVAARCAGELVFMVGAYRGDFEGAQAWKRHGDALVARSEIDGFVEAMLASNFGTVLYLRGRLDEALDHHRRGLATIVRTRGPDDYRVASVHLAIASIELTRSNWAQAVEHTNEALEIQKRVLGPDHPLVATSHHVLGGAYYGLSELGRSKTHYEQCLAIREVALGPRHPEVATTLASLGGTLEELGDIDGAIEQLRRAAELFTGEHRNHPHRPMALTNLGNTLAARGDDELARRRYEEAVAAYEETMGPTAAKTWLARSRLAVVLARLGRTGEALALGTQAVAGVEAAENVPPDHLAEVVARVGEVQLLAERKADAIAGFERALKLREAAPTRPRQLAYSRFSLARALIDDDPARAIALAQSARDTTNIEHDRREVEAWLAAAAR